MKSVEYTSALRVALSHPRARQVKEMVRRSVPYLVISRILPDGTRVWRYFGDHSTPRIVEEVHGLRVYEALPSLVPRVGETVVDIGAHVGLYALRAAQQVGRDGSVIAVEADPKNYALLVRNARRSKGARILPVHAALWSEPGALQLHRDAMSYGLHSVVGATSGDSVRVEAETLDRLVSRLSPKTVSVVKLDVEGAELPVLQGAKETLARRRPRLVCEAGHTIVEALPLAEFLRFLDYSVEVREVWFPGAERPDVYVYAIAT